MPREFFAKDQNLSGYCSSVLIETNRQIIINKMKALIIVDVQNDFCEGGSLEVKNSNTIFPFINHLVKYEDFSKIFITKDWHPLTHSSFAINHDKQPFEAIINSEGENQILWPVHCVQYSKGSELSSLLDLDGKKVIEIRKGYNLNEESYSGFGTQKNPTKLLKLLKRNKIEEVVIVGLALDFCVGNTALDAVKNGLKATVIEQATRAVSEETAKSMLEQLKNHGVRLVSFKEIADGSLGTLESSDDSSNQN